MADFEQIDAPAPDDLGSIESPATPGIPAEVMTASVKVDTAVVGEPITVTVEAKGGTDG